MASGNLPRPEQIGNNEDWPLSFAFVGSDGTTPTDISLWTNPVFALRSCDDVSGAADLTYTSFTKVGNAFVGAVPEGATDGSEPNTMRSLVPGSYNLEFKVDTPGADAVYVRGQVDVLGGFS